MNCTACGAPAVQGDTFCSACGAALTAPAAPQPTQAMPAQPVAAAPQPAAQPVAAMPTAPPPPPPKMGAGAIVAITLGSVLLVAALGVGGFFGWRALSADTDQPPTDTTTLVPTEVTAEETATPAGFATAAEAMADYLPQEWVSKVVSDNGDVVEYAMGPPASEFSNTVTVTRQSDGSWTVTDSRPIEMGDVGEDPADAALNQAATIVDQFITAVMEDRPNDAQALTISPFSEDPASASYGNGDLLGFSIADARLMGDGSTVEVTSEEDWVWNVERYVYTCVPTANGYRISELRPE